MKVSPYFYHRLPIGMRNITCPAKDLDYHQFPHNNMLVNKKISTWAPFY